VADEEVLAQVNGTEVVDAGAIMVEAKVRAQVVDVGQCLVGMVGTPREVQEAEAHLPKAAAGRVH
jgi:hypothetical protein